MNDDLIEPLGYFAGFWLFLFSPTFRAEVLRDWRERPWFLQVLIPFEVAIATVVGLAPVALVWWAIQN